MMTQFTLFSNATNQKNAITLLNRVTKLLGYEDQNKIIEKYEKGGYKVCFLIPMENEQWSKTVINILQLAQTIGNGWILSGNINECLDLWSNEIKVSGIVSCQIYGAMPT